MRTDRPHMLSLPYQSDTGSMGESIGYVLPRSFVPMEGRRRGARPVYHSHHKLWIL